MSHDLDGRLIAAARHIADDVLFPAANVIDQADDVPRAQLDAIADAGLYGASIDAAPETVAAVIEALASGCLTTAFVYTQHLGAAAAAEHCTGEAHRFAQDLRTGRLRGGVAFAHMLRPDPPVTTATRVAGGWAFRGSAPWVTGWGHIDLLHAAARAGDDIVWALIDAAPGPTLTVAQPPLATVNASRTVEVTFADHFVPDDRVTEVINHLEWKARYALGLRNNGSFPLGVAARCCRLLPDDRRPQFVERLDQLRQALDDASRDDMAEARAQAALFAVTASTALVAAVGGRAVTLAHHGQRLHREAMFLLVQGQTPAIKASMLDQLARR